MTLKMLEYLGHVVFRLVASLNISEPAVPWSSVGELPENRYATTMAIATLMMVGYVGLVTVA